jgi:hypothetical protein
MNILQIQTELVQREYPHLLPNDDPDIERYFFLRNTGRSQDALNLYRSRLTPRYPNDEFRTVLLRLYRNKNPAYKALQAKAYQALGVRCLEKMKRLIGFVADRADSYNPRDVYSTIRAAELIKQVLPQERYEAMATMERLFRYSQVLNLRTQSLYRATELIRAYLSDTLTVVDQARRRREDAQKRAVDERRRRMSDLDVSNYGWKNKPAPIGDLMDAVVFSPAELAHIEIPGTITRPEDKTLAYCAKYWNRTEDHSFERILFLYSRKYGEKNYGIFKVIQRGKQGKKRDDEILAAVMSCLITGYYYSVMGDKYVQRSWAVIKVKLQTPAAVKAARPAAASDAAEQRTPTGAGAEAWSRMTHLPERPQVSLPVAAASQPGTASLPKPAAPEATATPKPAAPVVAAMPKPAVPEATATPKPAVPVVTTLPKPAAPVVAATPKPAAPVVATTPKPATPEATTTPKPAAPVVAATPKPAIPAAAEPSLSAKAGMRPPLPPVRPVMPPKPVSEPAATQGSVSQRLQELSGRSYDVFQDRFLAHARPAIRKVLGANRGLFFAIPTQAEDLVFDFLKAHYDDPYMNWEKSGERDILLKMGFDLQSVLPVIDECYSML